MSWFDDQIQMRKSCDEEILSTSLQNMMTAVADHSYGYIVVRDGEALRDALKQLLSFFHIKYRELPKSCKEITDQLDYLFSSSGIMYRPVKLTKGWQRDGMMPMLGTLGKDGSAVALLPSAKGNFYTCVDPKTGHVLKVNSALAQEISEDAYVFYKSFPMRKLSMRDFSHFISESFSKWDYMSFISMGLLITLVGMIIPPLNALLTGEVIKYESETLLLAVIQFMFLVTLSRFLFTVIKTLLLTRMKTKVSLQLQAASMMRILSMPMDFFQKYSTGEMTQIMQYMSSLGENLVMGIFSNLVMMLLSLLYLFQVAYYARSLLLAAILILLISFLISMIACRIQSFISKDLMEITAKEKGLLYGLISGIEKIRLTHAENRAFAKWANLYSKEASLTYNPPTFLKLHTILTNATIMMGSVIVYYVSVSSHISLAEYMAFNVAFSYVTAAFMSLSQTILQFAAIRPTLELIRPLMETEPELMEEKEYLQQLRGAISLSHVSFKYSADSPLILDDITLNIPSRQYVAIVGKTGCGKSTLLKLLLGFEKPTRGSIYYDKKDLRRLNLRSLRKKAGIVLQDSQLFAGSIYENIAISNPSLTLEEAWEAAAIAGIAQDIASMPLGMSTLIQEGAGGISGGQKQRLIIARAIASKPKLLIFDEATSALDNVAQKQISMALDSMNCTRIVIAHRLSTIKNCDRILVLDHGKIVEDGNYESLMEMNGYFADLVRRQQ